MYWLLVLITIINTINTVANSINDENKEYKIPLVQTICPINCKNNSDCSNEFGCNNEGFGDDCFESCRYDRYLKKCIYKPDSVWSEFGERKCAVGCIFSWEEYICKSDTHICGLQNSTCPIDCSYDSSTDKCMPDNDNAVCKISGKVTFNEFTYKNPYPQFVCDDACCFRDRNIICPQN